MACSAEQAIAQVVCAHRQREESRRPPPGAHGWKGSVEHGGADISQDFESELVAEVRGHWYTRAAAAEHIMEPILDSDMWNPVARQREAPSPAMGDAHSLEIGVTSREMTEDAARFFM